MKRHGLRDDIRGATIVEFALVAPLLLLFIFGIIEAARAFWAWQMAQETAYVTARCVAIGDPQCSNDTAARQFAIAHARKSGFDLPLSGITINNDVTCDGLDDMDRVVLTIPYGTVTGGLIPALPASIQVTACMPAADAS